MIEEEIIKKLSGAYDIKCDSVEICGVILSKWKNINIPDDFFKYYEGDMFLCLQNVCWNSGKIIKIVTLFFTNIEENGEFTSEYMYAADSKRVDPNIGNKSFTTIDRENHELYKKIIAVWDWVYKHKVQT